MVASPNKIYTSQKRSKFGFVFSLVGSSRAIFINNILYFAITHQATDNIISNRFSHFSKSWPPLFPKALLVL
jgi:hypothetical protein